MDKTNLKTRGGARAGAGRPKGTGNSISVKTLLEAIETETGVSFETAVARGYHAAQLGDDKHLQHKWTNLILSKVMSTQTRIEVEDHRNQIEEKQAAFAAAMANLIKNNAKNET